MITVDNLISAVKGKGYALFEQDNKNYNLNIIGVRSNTNVPGSFDDWFCYLWKYLGNWNLFNVKCTTDPGLYWLENPLSKLGTAILKAEQHRGMWMIGKHQGKYEALVQKKPVTVVRDFDRDKNLDYISGREETGLFGINHHRANSSKESIKVGRWSAGCQVTANPKDYEIERLLWKEAAKNWGNSFSYTLLIESDLDC